MARGWESKSVESQQEAAAARGSDRRRLSDAEHEIAALEHTRTRLLREIQSTGNFRFRLLKEKALAHVDNQIKALISKESRPEESNTSDTESREP